MTQVHRAVGPFMISTCSNMHYKLLTAIQYATSYLTSEQLIILVPIMGCLGGNISRGHYKPFSSSVRRIMGTKLAPLNDSFLHPNICCIKELHLFFGRKTFYKFTEDHAPTKPFHNPLTVTDSKSDTDESKQGSCLLV